MDAVIVSRGRKRLFLLGMRKNKPAQKQWFLIGGRILRGEKLEDSIKRHVLLETGIKKMNLKKLLGVGGIIFKTSEQGPSVHTVSFVYFIEVAFRDLNPANKENSELSWFSKIDRRWHPYVKEMLRSAGFK